MSDDRPPVEALSAHPWRSIPLEVYESHMADASVTQLQRLHRITGEKLADNPCSTIGVLGVAGGNGLDLIDADRVQAVDGYDINPDYLDACERRYRSGLGERLHLVETTVDRSLRIAPVGLLIANLIVEYVGLEEFVAFATENIRSIRVLSCVTQRSDVGSFVSATKYSSSFDALATVSTDIDADSDQLWSMRDTKLWAVPSMSCPTPRCS